MTQKDMLNKLYKEYGLATEDVFSHKHYKIITRSGIEKIQAKAGITINFIVEASISTVNNVVMRAVGTKGEATVTTFASAHEGNCNSNYYAEMAEKRALSRVVLKLEGLYEHGFFGEDEADAFSKGAQVKTAKVIN